MMTSNFKIQKLLLIIVLTFTTAILQSQNNTPILKAISGRITHLNAPLANVNIIILDSNSGTKTNALGAYSINAKPGNIIKYSHVGFNTISIIVEDITSVLNIEMTVKINQLAETVVTARKVQYSASNIKRERGKPIMTAIGMINPESFSGKLSYFDKNDFLYRYDSFSEFWGSLYIGTGQFITGVRETSATTRSLPGTWDVDGVIYRQEPPINLNRIIDIHVIESGATKWGYQGGVVIVRTLDSPQEIAKRNEAKAEQYRNQNYYSDDAIVLNLNQLITSKYTDTLESFNSKQKAFEYYELTLKPRLSKFSEHVDIARNFLLHYKYEHYALQIFNSLIEKYQNNPEVLKTVAYYLQSFNLNEATIEVYKKSFKLRPGHAQSYRDLANAFVENNQYKKAWRLYISYLMQGYDVSGKDISDLFYSEMEFLYYNKKNQSGIKETFIPKSKNLFDFRSDIRLVFEWNTSEAEFDLEFVNADKRVYVFEHSLDTNEALITDEKQKGYSSKAFNIDDIGLGEWLVNITYKGNKKPEPTYFKVTKYLHWGNPNQTQEVSVYKFESEREKIQLMRLNKEMLATAN